jgi:hypothetical protein
MPRRKSLSSKRDTDGKQWTQKKSTTSLRKERPRTMLDRVRSIIRVFSTEAKWRDLLFQYEQRKIAKSGCGSFSAGVRPD